MRGRHWLGSVALEKFALCVMSPNSWNDFQEVNFSDDRSGTIFLLCSPLKYNKFHEITARFFRSSSF